MEGRPLVTIIRKATDQINDTVIGLTLITWNNEMFVKEHLCKAEVVQLETGRLRHSHTQ